MRYIYYIVAIVIIASGLAVYGAFDTKVEISKPFISVNDRIISQDEFNRMLKRKPHYMNRDQFIHSVIEKQLLIQEAVKQKINQEESFRQSVENFYEQSLIKILMDRKLNSLVVDVTDAELERYEMLLGRKMMITKTKYATLNDAEKNMNGKKEIINADFEALSADLKFELLNLDEGDSSKPKFDDFGYAVYTLDEISPIQKDRENITFDMRKVSVLLQDKKKERILEEWAQRLRENAKIWRKE